MGGPAIGVPRSGRTVTAQTAAAKTIEYPDRQPGSRRFVIQNNRVACGIGEGTLTVGSGQTREGGTAIGRNRCSRKVEGGLVDTA